MRSHTVIPFSFAQNSAPNLQAGDIYGKKRMHKHKSSNLSIGKLYKIAFKNRTEMRNALCNNTKIERKFK